MVEELRRYLREARSPATRLQDDLVVLGCQALRRDRPPVKAAMFCWQDVATVIAAVEPRIRADERNKIQEAGR